MGRRDLGCLLAGVGLVLTGLVATPSASVADTAPRTEVLWSNGGGTGTAHARARARSGGHLVLATRTIGGRAHRSEGPRRSFARAEATVSETFQVEPGTYRVRVTYAGIRSRRHAEGRSGRFGVRRTTTADFVSAGGGGDSGVRRIQALPRDGTVSTDLTLTVFPETRGKVVASAEVVAWSVARGPRARSRIWTTVRDVQVQLTRVG